MKTILAAVNFSAASHNAALYATELAKAFNAKLILVYACQPIPVPVSDLIVTFTPQQQDEEIMHELKEEAEALDPIGITDIETDYG